MLRAFGSVVPGLPALGLLKATPRVTPPDETIDGFPEFTVTVDLIEDPEVKKKLKTIAKRIVQSHNGRARIIGFEVHGHADATLRIQDRAEAARTEEEVSQERADNAKDLLLQLIEDEGGKPIIAGIRANAEAKGFGSKHRIFVPARDDTQMKKNRRVEIFLKEFNPPPPRPTPPPQPRPKPQPDVGSNWRIQILDGGLVTTVGIPETELSTMTILLFVDITDRDRKQKARFRVFANGLAHISASVGVPSPIQQSVVTQGSSATDFTTTRGTTLDRFAGKVEVMQDPGASVSVLSVGGNFNFSFTALEEIGTFARPSVVSANAGSSALSLPQGGLGGVTTGTMTMQGSPTTVP